MLNRKVKNFSNKYQQKGSSWIPEYNGGCEFPWPFHRGKVDWHHPISSREDVGVYLCEAHHSLIMGRRKLYVGESIINPLYELRDMVQKLVVARINEYGYTEADIDKH